MANETTLLQLAPLVAKLSASEALPLLRDNLVMGQLVDKSYEASFQNGGDVISIPIAPSLVANDISEAGSVQPQTAAYGSTDLVLNRHKEVTIVVPDITRTIVTNQNFMQDLMRSQMIAIAESVEDEIMGQIPILTYNTPLGTAGTALTESILDTAETSLFQAKVPDSDPKIALMGPVAYGQARQISRFTEVRMVGGAGEAIKSGKIPGELKGFIPIRSNRVPIAAGSPPTNYNLAFGSKAITLAMRRMPSAPAGTGAITEYAVDPVSGYAMRITVSYNAQILALQITVDVLFGVAILRPEYAVQFIV